MFKIVVDKLDSVYLMPYKQKSLVWYVYIFLNDVINIVLTVDAVRERQRQQGSEQQPLPMLSLVFCVALPEKSIKR